MTHDADLTGLLQAWNRGDDEALSTLTHLVEKELREIARRLLADERRDGRWQPTELVQESYLRLLDWRAVQWQNRAHFFATVSRMMRRVLVDAARTRRAIKRGRGVEFVELADVSVAEPVPLTDLIAVEQALSALERISARASQVVTSDSSAVLPSKRPPRRCRSRSVL